MTHFAANPAVLFRNSSTRIHHFQQGMSNAWLVGEAGSDYQPWGYPFNWREITGPLNQSTGSFGRPEEDGALFLLGDGTVRSYSSRIDDGERMPTIMLHNPALPEPTSRSRPPHKFELTGESGFPFFSWKSLDDNDDLESVGAETIRLADGSVGFLQIRGSYKVGFDSPTIDHLRKAVGRYRCVKTLLLPIPLVDQVSELITTLPELTHVYAKSVAVSESGAEVLCGINTLKLLLVEILDDETADHFAKHMSGFEIRRGRVP